MTEFRITWRHILAFILISTLLAVTWAKHVTFLRGVANWWVVSDHLNVSADAIVVLGGSFETRPEAAADLFKRGLAKQVLVLNPENDNPPTGLNLQDQTFAKLQMLGVPAVSLINLPRAASNTYKEARSVLDWAKETGAKDIIVPTDLFHTRRARWIFAKELGTAGISVRVFAINHRTYSLNNWWRHKEAWSAFLSEIAKYLFYRIRY